MAQNRERHELDEMIRLLAKSELLRLLPPEEVEALLTGDPGDALYVVDYTRRADSKASVRNVAA